MLVAHITATECLAVYCGAVSEWTGEQRTVSQVKYSWLIVVLLCSIVARVELWFFNGIYTIAACKMIPVNLGLYCASVTT